MPESQALFDEENDWRSQPMVAFAAFVRSIEFVDLGRRRHAAQVDATAHPRPLKASSATVYLRMFGTVVRWLDAHGKTLFDITPVDLEQFLDQSTVANGQRVKKLNSAIRIRYLRLIERVLIHLAVVPNPAQHLCFAMYRQRQSGIAGRDEPKAVLSDAEQNAFMQALPFVAPATPGQRDWKRRRDRAMQALMLGAGLTVAEVLALRLDQIGARDAGGSVPIALDTGAANSVTRPHRTQLRPFAVEEVLSWVATRQMEKSVSKLLFPAKAGSNLLLNPATVYRQVKATFERAGIDPKRWGGRTLRNTFAVRELAETGSTELVGEFLGHRLQRSTLYYQAAANQRKAAPPRMEATCEEEAGLFADASVTK